MAVACLCFIFAFALSVGITPVVRSTVLRFGWVDAAGRSHRKVHANDIPRLGGIAIVLGFFLPIAAVAAWRPDVIAPLFASDPDLALAFFVGAGAIAVLGVYDDIVGSTPRQKLAVQLIVALAIVAAGFRIERVDLPFVRAIELGWLSYPLSVVWIVGVTNAVNLIDGLDGLAAGISIIGVLPVAVAAVVGGQVVLALVALTLIGALAGFLVHNFHPAKIFMGDTGSMFLGFVLAVVTVQITQKVSVAASLGAPLIALALPIFDTITSMGRRVILGKPMFSPDREHFHHRMFRFGFSHRGVVLSMYACGLVFSLLATALLLYRGPIAGIALVLSAAVSIVLLHLLGYFGTHRNLSEAIAAALELRRRNRAMYGALSVFKKRAGMGASIPELAEQVLAVAKAAGASWAQVSLPAYATTWEEGVPNAEPTTEVALFDQNGKHIGALRCTWSCPADGAVLHVLESTRDIFEKRIIRMQPEGRTSKAA